MAAAGRYKLPTDFSKRGQVSHTYWVRGNTPADGHRQVSETWSITRTLGQGTFGLVRLESRIHGTGPVQLRAVKQIQKTSSFGQDREIEAIVQLVQHNRDARDVFAKFYGWFDDAASIYIAMEFFPLGDLRKHMPSLTEQAARNITVQVLRGVKAMHSVGIAHRDLKPENFLVQQISPKWIVKITDFGLAKNEFRLVTAPRGTPGYMAPEIGAAPDYTAAVDMWSMGCIIYEMLFHRRPFDPREPGKRDEYHRGGYLNGQLPPGTPMRTNISPRATTLILQLLHPHADLRPSATSVLESSEWLHEEGFARSATAHSYSSTSTDRAHYTSTPARSSNGSVTDISHQLSVYSSPGSGAQGHRFALEAADELIGKGAMLVPRANCPRVVAESRSAEAREKFALAIERLESIPNLSPKDDLGRYRRLTYVSLELTYVTRIEEHESYLQDAERYNRKARHAANQIGHAQRTADGREAKNAQTKVQLDAAKICARRGRVTLKQAASRRQLFNNADPKSACDLLIEAFRTYEGQAALYGTDETSAVEFDLRAQALQGCGEIVQVLLGSEDGIQAHARNGLEQPGTYFERGLRSVRDGLGEPDGANDAGAALQNTAACIKSVWKRVDSHWNSNTLVGA